MKYFSFHHLWVWKDFLLLNRITINLSYEILSNQNQTTFKSTQSLFFKWWLTTSSDSRMLIILTEHSCSFSSIGWLSLINEHMILKNNGILSSFSSRYWRSPVWIKLEIFILFLLFIENVVQSIELDSFQRRCWKKFLFMSRSNDDLVMGLLSIYMEFFLSALFYTMSDSISDRENLLIDKLSHYGTYTKSIDKNLSSKYDTTSDAILSIENVLYLRSNINRFLHFDRVDLWICQRKFNSKDVNRTLDYWGIIFSNGDFFKSPFLFFPSPFSRFTPYSSKTHLHRCLSR
jgi:hypothetical protein